jgi:hypothetical protein
MLHAHSLPFEVQGSIVCAAHEPSEDWPCRTLALIEAVASLTAENWRLSKELQEACGDYIALAADEPVLIAQLEQERAKVAALREALEAVRTAAAWRDDLGPQERLRMCLVASRAALES